MRPMHFPYISHAFPIHGHRFEAKDPLGGFWDYDFQYICKYFRLDLPLTFHIWAAVGGPAV